MTSNANWEVVNAALGCVFASVLESTAIDLHNSFRAITGPGVLAQLKSLVKGPDAEAAYAAWLEFKDVVKANQVATAAASSASMPGAVKIGEAAKKLSAESYPFLQGID